MATFPIPSVKASFKLRAIQTYVLQKKLVSKKSSIEAPSDERISQSIRLLRGHRVTLDLDLAVLYDVETKVLLQAVKRNHIRFPGDFMFQLSNEEFENLRSQIVTSSWGGRRRPPYAFTEQGVAMLSSVLRSKRAVQVNIEIMRTFVRLRQLFTEHAEMAEKLTVLENKYDARFKLVFDAIRVLMDPPEPNQERSIGYTEWED